MMRVTVSSFRMNAQRTVASIFNGSMGTSLFMFALLQGNRIAL